MIRKSDFKNIIELSEHIRTEQIGQHIKQADDLDFKGLVGDVEYNAFYENYKIRKNVATITVGVATILTIDSTANINQFDYCYLNDFLGADKDKLNGKRFKYVVLNATQIKLIEIIEDIEFNNSYEKDLDSTGWTVSSGAITNFCKLEYFNLLRPYMVYATYLRWASSSHFTNSEAGLVEKRLDFSQQPTPQSVGALVARCKSDLQIYKERILVYLQTSITVQEEKEDRMFIGVVKPNPYSVSRYKKRDVL